MLYWPLQKEEQPLLNPYTKLQKPFNDWISATPALWHPFLWGVDPPPEEWLGED